MIFHQVEQVLDGTKTQTRRSVNIGNLGDFAITDTLYTVNTTDRHVVVYGIKGRAKWETGKTYAVQPGRGKKAMGRIRITRIRREQLKAINEADCLAEGIIEHLYQANVTPPFGFLRFECPICETQYEWAREAYRCLWNDIYGRRAWDRMKDNNVWVLDFEVVKE